MDVRARDALATGDVAGAAALLGRPYRVCGRVVQGDARGRELGVPTANLAVTDDVVLPADGVYAGWYARPDGVPHAAAISIGRRPTFYEERGLLLVEAHLLDFRGDLYGEEGCVDLVDRVRGQSRFDSVDALVAEMHRDVAATRRLLGRPGPGAGTASCDGA